METCKGVDLWYWRDGYCSVGLGSYGVVAASCVTFYVDYWNSLIDGGAWTWLWISFGDEVVADFYWPAVGYDYLASDSFLFSEGLLEDCSAECDEGAGAVGADSEAYGFGYVCISAVGWRHWNFPCAD